MTDKNLVNNILKRKHWAFTIFYNNTVDSFYSYLRWNFFLTDSEINDLIAETFLKIRDNLDSFDPNRWNFSWWCWTILRNNTKDFFKKRKERWFSDYEKTYEDWWRLTIEEQVEDKSNMLEELEWDYKFEEIESAMDNLKADEREILFLRFAQEKSFREISQILWVKESNLRVKTHRSIKKLQKTLKNL